MGKRRRDNIIGTGDGQFVREYQVCIASSHVTLYVELKLFSPSYYYLHRCINIFLDRPWPEEILLNNIEKDKHNNTFIYITVLFS